jgi:Tfp pilus assembly protein PilN
MKETLNLLPAEHAEKAARKRGIGFYLVAGCICYGAVLGGLWVRNTMELNQVSAEVSSLSQKKAEFLARIQASSSASAARATPEEEIYHELQAAHPWSEVLRELSLIVPDRVWLASLETRWESNSIGVKGYALSQMDIASFIALIERSDIFEGVEIVSSQKGEKEVFFELKARLTWTEKK